MGKKGESVQHLVIGCEKLAQKEYKRLHDNVAKKVSGTFVRRMGMNMYKHIPEGAVENEEVTVLWNINVHCDSVMEARRVDTIVN